MDDELEISDGLRDALRDVTRRGRLEVPDAVDRRIRAAARRPRGRLLRLRRAVAAAAAALLLAVGLWALNGPFRGDAPVGDLNGDGAVDIVDAYVLDRRLGSGSSPARGDVTGDGRVDLDDLARLIERVVSIGRSG
jgi:hypothetical protein